MQHDIYSVGIVLLEIGLWASLVSYQGADTDNATAAPSTLLAPLLVRPLSTDLREQAYRDLHVLISLAKSRLPSGAGQKYTDVVLLCLNCLEHGDGSSMTATASDSGAAASSSGAAIDADGIGIGVSFIETVIEMLHEISV
jgi:hypothetical protein